ncbi:MAG: DUF5684 domain-containing protein [Patescibacteria group bacterium]
MGFMNDSNAATLVFLLIHAVMAAVLWKMAARTKEGPEWFALVPILNVVLMLKVAKKPLWWVFLFFIPVVNFVTMVVATMALCERFRVNKWWGLLALLSPFNIVLYAYLAYGTENPPAAPPVAPQA